MHHDHEKFIEALEGKRKVMLKFYSKDDGREIERTCAPMDYGPSRRSNNDENRYHLWDYDSDKEQHTLSLLESQITNIAVLDENFDPKEFITWDVQKSPWFYERDWGIYS